MLTPAAADGLARMASPAALRRALRDLVPVDDDSADDREVDAGGADACLGRGASAPGTPTLAATLAAAVDLGNGAGAAAAAAAADAVDDVAVDDDDGSPPRAVCHQNFEGPPSWGRGKCSSSSTLSWSGGEWRGGEWVGGRLRGDAVSSERDSGGKGGDGGWGRYKSTDKSMVWNRNGQEKKKEKKRNEGVSLWCESWCPPVAPR